MNNLFKSTGVLRYSDDFRLALEVDQGISDFYRSLLPKSVERNKPRWPAHITVVRQEKEKPVHTQYWRKYDNQSVDFYYSPIVHEGKVYYWLNAFCTDLEQIRAELGLPVVSQYTLPPEGFKKCFHITIANMKFNQLDTPS